MRFLKCKSGVSHLIGYMLTLSLTTVIITITIITTNTLIDTKARDAAEIYAENIANKVASTITNICSLKKQYPDLNYSIDIDLPFRLVDRFSYYVEIDKNAVYVKTYDGAITKTSSIYNVTEEEAIGFSSSKVSGDEGSINISINSYDYVYKFDFGSNTSTGKIGYTKITHLSKDVENPGNFYPNPNPPPDLINTWKYRTNITIKNPVGPLTDYQVLVKLNDSNFDYSLADCNGSDLLFTDKTGAIPLNYWIERWYPKDTHVSRIWVKVPSLSYPEDIICMYYGKQPAPEYYLCDGEQTFEFFDDFTKLTVDSSKWTTYQPGPPIVGEIYIKDGELVITNGSCVISKNPPDSNTIVIEAKAKTVGDKREASMFARYIEDPLNYIFFFSANGSFLNFSLMDLRTGFNTSNKPVNQEWNRLTLIMNDVATVACRYYYENYTLNGFLSNISSPLKQGKFSLFTTDDNTTAYFDWIFVRKFAAKFGAGVDSLEESIPTAHVLGTDSKDFGWADISKVKSDEYIKAGVTYGFVCNKTTSNSATFRISNFQTLVPAGETCSLVFTVGDPNRYIDEMNIEVVAGSETKSYEHITCEYTTKKIRIDINSADTIDITFSDTGGNNYYWAVDDLTIQRGNRVITVIGGK